MSWVRLGSKCYQGWPFRQSPCTAAPGPCPGSDVYVYEGSRLTCCGCLLTPTDDEARCEFMCDTDAEMIEHLRAHIAAGHHVAVSLLSYVSAP